MAEAKDEPLPRWLPLESNPDMLNAFAKRMGLPAGFSYVDVWGLDAEILAMQPELAKDPNISTPIGRTRCSGAR